MCATVPAVPALSPLSDTPLGEFADAGLEQLVGRNMEEVRDPVQIAQLPAAFPGEELADPHVAPVAPFR